MMVCMKLRFYESFGDPEMVGIMNTICKTIGRGLFKNQSKQLETEQGTKTQQHPKLMRAIGFSRQRTRLKMKIFVTLAFTENRTSFSCNPLCFMPNLQNKKSALITIANSGSYLL